MKALQKTSLGSGHLGVTEELFNSHHLGLTFSPSPCNQWARRGEGEERQTLYGLFCSLHMHCDFFSVQADDPVVTNSILHFAEMR